MARSHESGAIARRARNRTRRLDNSTAAPTTDELWAPAHKEPNLSASGSTTRTTAFRPKLARPGSSHQYGTSRLYQHNRTTDHPYRCDTDIKTVLSPFAGFEEDQHSCKKLLHLFFLRKSILKILRLIKYVLVLLSELIQHGKMTKIYFDNANNAFGSFEPSRRTNEPSQNPIYNSNHNLVEKCVCVVHIFMVPCGPPNL
jgi:hypothetical protein